MGVRRYVPCGYARSRRVVILNKVAIAIGTETSIYGVTIMIWKQKKKLEAHKPGIKIPFYFEYERWVILGIGLTAWKLTDMTFKD